MQRKILYIINPVSGTKNKGLLKEIISKKTAEAGFHSAIYPSVANGDYSFLYDTITDEGFTDVVIAGGDGTINGVVNSLRHLNIRFGILPFGSGNGLAFSANIPKNLDRALQVIFKGKTNWVDAFMVNESFACMLCGLGFDAQVAHDFANDPQRGLATYIRKTVKNFFTSQAYPFALKIGEKQIKTEAFFISIANSNQFGNHFTIAPQASLSDGLLDIVIMAKQSKLSFLWQAMLQFGGFHQLQEINVLNEKANVIYFQAQTISISNVRNAPMHIDGDPVETKKQLHVQLLKNCFRLIQ